MNLFSVLTMLGGLALFLYGMNVMGSGLEKLSGGKLESILEKLTSNPIKGVLLGAAVTAVIQSSSAVTVMVVGFVNSGIMQLYRAVGVIMGANIGTTVTAWILSLTGIQGDSILVSLFKPTSFSPVLALIGVVILMTSKSQKKRDIGNILIGFAVLMFGMNTMSDAVKPLADMPEFTNILVKFTNPFLGIIVGMLLTAVIQSSSASVGILQALCMTGTISYSMAIPIILGQNIGTCVTALISSIGTSTNAKRASMVHLYFNVIGSSLFAGLFLIARNVLHLEFLGEIIDPAGVAIVHSIFNILATILLLPFSKALEKLAILTVREKKPSGKQGQAEFPELVDDRFIITPSYAIEKCGELTIKMAELAKENIMLAIGMISTYSQETKQAMDKNEDEIDALEDKLETYLMKISSMELTAQDAREMSKLHHAIGNFERIGDYGINILKTLRGMDRKGTRLSGQAYEELQTMSSAVTEILDISIRCYQENDAVLACYVEPLEQVIDKLKDDLRIRHLKRFESGDCTVEQGFAFLDIISSFERIGDHCSNIAVTVIEMEKNAYQTHEYLSHVKSGNNRRFTEYYDNYAEKYALS